MATASSDVLKSIDQRLKREFDQNQRVLSFEEYLTTFTQNSARQMRSSAQYMVDMMDHFGHEAVEGREDIRRFKLFDEPVDGIAPKLVGHEDVQTEVYQILKSFVSQRMNNKLILLHGPNGSAKTTLVHALMNGLQRYSRTTEGASYTFNWVFPSEKITRGSMGITHYDGDSSFESYAKLPDAELASRIPCDMKDHPLLLVPKEHRREVLGDLLGKDEAERLWAESANYFVHGDLCHRCKQIYEALLATNSGDYKKVLRHIQVERFYYSRRYRKGLSTVEPQMHVDARYDQLTLNRSIQALPASLQGINFFSVSGDLVDGNRGVVEYSDLLKRPIDTFKYLLNACETGSVNVGSTIAYLDSVMLGSSNELQLDAFKEFPDFSSFKARIELVRVPYLLRPSQEAEIYSLLKEQMAGGKHVSPHVAETLALWAVLTRMKKPNSINYPPNISALVSALSPVEKVRLYDRGELPDQLSPEDRKLLRSNIDRIRDEYHNIPYYEGRVGASVREIKTILFDAAHLTDLKCLSPLGVLRVLEDFVKQVSEYEFLKQDVKDGYHDAKEFIRVVEKDYLDKVDHEVRSSIGLYDTQQWEGFIQKYVLHISALLKKEKLRNPTSGQVEDPDQSLISEYEKITQAPTDTGELDRFRQGVISQIGAWSLDHPGEEVTYGKVFPEHWKRLEKHYFESQKALLTKMHNALLVYNTERHDPHSEGSRLAKDTIDNMVGKLGYCETCARDVITVLIQKRY